VNFSGFPESGEICIIESAQGQCMIVLIIPRKVDWLCSVLLVHRWALTPLRKQNGMIGIGT